MTSHEKAGLKPWTGRELNTTTNNHSCSETHNHEVLDSKTEQQVYSNNKLKPRSKRAEEQPLMAIKKNTQSIPQASETLGVKMTGE